MHNLPIFVKIKPTHNYLVNKFLLCVTKIYQRNFNGFILYGKDLFEKMYCEVRAINCKFKRKNQQKNSI